MKETAVDIRIRDNQSRDGQERRFNGQGRRDNRIVMARTEITRVDVALITETARIITVIRDRTTVRTAETEAVASMETETDKTETIRTETIRVAVVLITTETV